MEAQTTYVMDVVKRINRMLDRHAELCAKALDMSTFPGSWSAFYAGQCAGKAEGMACSMGDAGLLSTNEGEDLQERARTTFTLMNRKTWPIAEWCMREKEIPPMAFRDSCKSEAEYREKQDAWHLYHNEGPERVEMEESTA